MSRLTHSLIRRRSSVRAVIAVAPRMAELEVANRWMEDARLFAAGWVAGLVVFGTLLA